MRPKSCPCVTAAGYETLVRKPGRALIVLLRSWKQHLDQRRRAPRRPFLPMCLVLAPWSYPYYVALLALHSPRLGAVTKERLCAARRLV